jgi:DNA-binding protein H-NS
VKGKTLPLVFQAHTGVRSFSVATRRWFVARTHASCAHPCITNDSADALAKALHLQYFAAFAKASHHPMRYAWNLHNLWRNQMSKLAKLLAEQKALDAEIEKLQGPARLEAIRIINDLMQQYELTLQDVVGKVRSKPGPKPKSAPEGKASGKKASTVKGKKAPIKFRNKATGDSWSGRGLKPRWLSALIASGKKLEDLAV